MATIASEEPSMRTSVDPYREAELRLWRHHGLEPQERFIELVDPALRLRVLEVGSGEPLLFVHGTVGPGGWPSLVSELPGFRSIVLDRPGWGMSPAVRFSGREYGPFVAKIMRGAMDALELDRASVVGGSIGNVWALRLAELFPERVKRVVLTGGGPMLDEAGVPGIIRVIASPLGAVMVRLPDKPARVRTILRKVGHGPSLDAGRIPDEFIDWRVAASRGGAMRNEREMITAIVKGSEYRPGLTLTDSELTRIDRPVLHVFGTGDPTGSVDLWGRMARALPHGQLHLVDGAGHEPWFDEPVAVADAVRGFLGK